MSEPKNRDRLTENDKEAINGLLLELATELDLHYDDEDMFALTPSFDRIKQGIELLRRVGYEVHPDVLKILARYNRSNQ